MKKILALLAVVLGVVSCQTEPEGLDVNVGGEQEVAICVTIPETETRAGGLNSALGVFDNGILTTDATMRYILQVYYKTTENGEVKYTASKERLVKYNDGKSVTFPVRLVPNRDYQFVVWADVVDAEADVDKHYNTADLTNVTLNTLNNPWVAMDETRDAFTATQLVENYNSTSSINITLKRPFAKLRVVTTDMVALNNLGIEPTKATVTYSVDHYNAFNALAGNAIGDSKNRTIKHENFVIASYNEYVAAGANMTLFTDYFFAEAGDVVKFELDVFDQNGVSIKKNNFNTDIAVQRNYLTTIQGNILTDGNNVKVTVEDTFANYDENGDLINPDYEYATISSEAELLAAIDNGGEYIVISDIEVNGLSISAQAATRSGVTTTINLNGKTITLLKDIEVKAGNTLIINNDPVDDAGNDEGAIVSENGKAIINNGTLNIEGGEFGENTIVNNGSANVSGGNFADDAIVNNGSVSVEGDNSGEEDRIIENGTNAVVSNIVYTVEELQAALDEGKVDEIIFGANLVGDATISQREGVNVYINGADKKFDGVLYIHGNARSTGAETVKIANINFESESAKYFIHANYQTEPERYAHNVTIEDCTFTSLADDNSVAVCGASFRQAYNVTIKNCTANNTFYLAWFSGCYNVAIEGCEAYNNYEGITLGRGSTTSIKNSKINAELYGVRIESVSSGVETHNVTIENCELNAFIPVSVRSLTTGKFNLALQGVNKLTRGGLYDIALCSNEYKEGAVAKAPTCEWTISGADNLIVFPREYAVNSVEQIAEALTLKSKVLFANDIVGDVYIAQQENFNVVIDGREYKFDGTFTIDGKNRNDGAETLTLKNINFYTESTDEKTFISCPGTYNDERERYSHNVTIDGCTFKASSLTENVGAISAQKTYHLAVKNCEAYNIHSLLQVQSCDNDVTVENVKVENCFSGISVGNTKTTSISNANIKTQKYGIRLDGEISRKVTVNVANSNIEAYIPIVARKVITDCNVDVNLTETTLVKNNNDMFDVVFQSNKDYEDGNVAPVAPTGNYTINGANDYIVYPRDVVSSWDEFTAALAANKTFFLLGADITYDKNYQLQKDVTIDLNGKSMTAPLIDIFSTATIKNGTINGRVYARKNCDITFDNVKFSGAISASHLQIQAGGTNIYAKDCLFSPTSASGSARPVEGEYGTSGNIKFENCEFKNSPYKGQIYINSLSATATLDFTNCNFNNKTPNIMFAATCPFTVFTMSGTTKLGSVSLETNRALDAITDEDYAYLKSLIKDNNNSISNVRLFYTGGSKYYYGN